MRSETRGSRSLDRSCFSMGKGHLEVVASRRLIGPVKHDWGFVDNLYPLDLALLCHAPAHYCSAELNVLSYYCEQTRCVESIGASAVQRAIFRLACTPMQAWHFLIIAAENRQVGRATWVAGRMCREVHTRSRWPSGAGMHGH